MHLVFILFKGDKMSNSCSNQNHNQKGDAKNQNNESCQKNSHNQANQCNANHEHKNDKK